MERKLASIRRIKEINPIKDADKIVCAVVDGWELVTQKSNNFKPGDLVVYFEIDSLLPICDEFSWLEPYRVSAKNSVEGEGYRLKTIKLRGQVSQGLILPLEKIDDKWFLDVPGTGKWAYDEGDDVTEALGVKKYEKPIPAQLAGKIRGNFPSFIKKTDQERIQNCFDDWFFNWKDQNFEVTLKLDGSSFTAYYKKDEDRFGVCSRNLDLIETDDNAFWQVARKLDLETKLRQFDHSVAVQGELMGPGVQGNREKLDELNLYVFDMFNIDTFKYMYSEERIKWCTLNGIHHVPIIDIHEVFSGFTSVKEFLRYAERPSLNHEQAEGIVFKSIKYPCHSFKVISNAYLVAEK